jgi:hypothetical protein
MMETTCGNRGFEIEEATQEGTLLGKLFAKEERLSAWLGLS